MPFGKEVGLDPGHIVLDGDPVRTQPPTAAPPHFQWRQRLPYFGGDERTSVPKDTESRGGEEWGGIPLSREGVSLSGPPPANYVSGDNRKLYILQ